MGDVETKPSTKVLGHVLLTERDHAILGSLYDNVVMTYGQIAKRHFANASKPTMINRLTRLELAGFIRRERIPRMTLGLDETAVGVVFQVTRRGIQKLRARYPEKEFRSDPIRIHPYTLHHDLILVDFVDALRVRFAGAVITNGRYWRLPSQGPAHTEPDLIVELANGQGRLAIELELSDKSERRYREIVLRYRLAKEFDRVIYFTARPMIRELLTRVILNRPLIKNEQARTGKFHFADFNQFIQSPMACAISNGEMDLGQKGESP